MDMPKISGLYDSLQVVEKKEGELDKEGRLRSMAGPLLAWYQIHARKLPWREDPEPYKVWVSEIMLQQTRVQAVMPYFERFMEALPGVEDLAQVSQERLFKLWEGLGYYNRARNLKAAAQVVKERHGGRLPDSYQALLGLPGIGSYTAGAIASIAYGIPVPAVDGNVLRVLSRVLGSREDISKQPVKRQMEEDLKKIIPQDKASSFNQGLIEVGALVCLPNGQPRCGECPFHSICLARIWGQVSDIPVRAGKKARKIQELTVLVLQRQGLVAIRKRKDSGLLASLYELPNLEGHWTEGQVAGFLGVCPGQVEALPSAKHIFTHVEWHMEGFRANLEGVPVPEACLMVSKQELESRYPLPNAFSTYTKLIK